MRENERMRTRDIERNFKEQMAGERRIFKAANSTSTEYGNVTDTREKILYSPLSQRAPNSIFNSCKKLACEVEPVTGAPWLTGAVASADGLRASDNGCLSGR